MEWFVAVTGCIFFSCAAWMAADFKLHSHAQALDRPGVRRYTCGKLVGVGTLWLLVVLVLSIPTVLFVLSTALPGNDNTLGISETMMKLWFMPAGFIMYGISMFIVPRLARILPKAFNKDLSLIHI